MANQSKSPMSIPSGGDVEFFRLVKLSSGSAVHNTATDTNVPVGVSQPAVGLSSYGSDNVVSVRDIKAGGTHKVEAAGSISKGADIYAADNGKVQALPGTAGTYRKVGQALEAASGDGSVIEAYLTPEGNTTTVSSS